jgi:hypothetical protein
MNERRVIPLQLPSRFPTSPAFARTSLPCESKTADEP